jgi:hypothetical protein
MRFEAYTVDDLVYSYCPAHGRWTTDHHGPIELVGPATPEVLKDMKRIRPRGPHYGNAKLPHALGNARVSIDEDEVRIDLRTTPFRFSGDGLYAWRRLAQRYGRSLVETPHLVVAEHVEDVAEFFRALGKDIEKWVVREPCKRSS